MTEQLIGGSISLELPKRFLDLIGDFDGIEVIQKFVERISDFFDDEEKEKLKKELPYICKNLVLQPIISHMIETDSTFIQSYEMSNIGIKLQIKYFNEISNMLNEDMEFNEIFKTIIAENSKMIKDILNNYKSSNNEEDDKISVVLQNISVGFCCMLEKSGFISLNEKVTKDKELMNIITSNIINPMINKLIQKLNKIQEEFEMENDEIERFSSELEKSLLISIPLQENLSIIITKAIDENISFSKAVSGVIFDEFLEQLFRKFSDDEKISIKIEAYGKWIDIIIDAMKLSF